MQGETRAVPKRTSWLGGWRAATLLMAAFLVGAMTSGALDPTDSNMAAPLLARSLSEWLFAVISAIAFTTVLGTVSGLIIACSGAVVHDLLGGVLRVEMNDYAKVRIGKLTAIVVGVVACGLGILFEKLNVSYLVGWAFSIAASARSITARSIWLARASALPITGPSFWKASLTAAGTGWPLATAKAARTT